MKIFSKSLTEIFLQRMSKFSVERSSSLHNYLDLVYCCSRNYWAEKKLLKEFDDFFKEIVSKMKIHSKEKSSSEDKNKKFVDFLFEEKNHFPEDEIIDHIKAIVYGVRLRKD